MNKKSNFVVIQDWMLDDVGLSGAELMVYACIYGFSQDGISYFQGSAGYLAKWAGVSKQQVFTVLKKLIEKNLIEKKEVFDNGVKFCNYRIITLGVVKKLDRGSQETLGVVKKLDRGSQETLGGVVKKLDRGSQETLSHNIDITYNHNIDNNIDTDSEEKQDVQMHEICTPELREQQKSKKETKHKHGEYKHVLLTDTEHNKLLEEWGEQELKRMICILDEGIEQKGYKYKNYYLAIKKWKANEARPSYITQKVLPPKPKEYCSCGGEIKYGVCVLCRKENCTI